MNFIVYWEETCFFFFLFLFFRFSSLLAFLYASFFSSCPLKKYPCLNFIHYFFYTPLYPFGLFILLYFSNLIFSTLWVVSLTCELFHGYLYNLVFGDRTHYCIPIFLLNRHLWLTSLSLTDLPPFLFLIPELEWSFSLFLVFTVHVQYLVKLFQFLVFSLRLDFFFFSFPCFCHFFVSFSADPYHLRPRLL